MDTQRTWLEIPPQSMIFQPWEMVFWQKRKDDEEKVFQENSPQVKGSII